jgi:23S rRNA pseudouridine955/2504/2580 synthase
MTDITKPQVKFVTVDEDYAGQRIDNFLKLHLKGVPKSMLYRILRKGEVRVNKKRVKPEYKIQANDLVRVPPVRVADESAPVNPKLTKVAQLENCIIHEDERIMVINKPSGIAVHGGSGLSFGLIEGLRALRPEQKFLELVHRIDRETSGILLVAKKRSALRHLHEQLREKKMQKRYHALVCGAWPDNRFKVKAPLQKNVLKSGERIVNVDPNGKDSETRYRVLEQYSCKEGQSITELTLVEAAPITGRTHQIRVHSLHAGHAILGDPKYATDVSQALTHQVGLQRLFLHAAAISFIHPGSGEQVMFKAKYDKHIHAVLQGLHKL